MNPVSSPPPQTEANMCLKRSSCTQASLCIKPCIFLSRWNYSRFIYQRIWKGWETACSPNRETASMMDGNTEFVSRLYRDIYNRRVWQWVLCKVQIPRETGYCSFCLNNATQVIQHPSAGLDDAYLDTSTGESSNGNKNQNGRMLLTWGEPSHVVCSPTRCPHKSCFSM